MTAMSDERQAVSAAGSFLSALHDQAARIHRDGATRHTFEVAGLPVEFFSPHAVDPARVARYLGMLSAQEPATAHGDKPVTIRLVEAASAADGLPGIDWLLNEHAGPGPLIRHRDARYTMLFNAHSGVLSSYDAQSGIGLQVIRDFDALPNYEWASPLRDLLGWTLSRRGRPLVHASAIAADIGGALLVGPSGSGKSTTAAAVTQFGPLEFVSDDFCAISLGDQGAKAHSLFRSAKLMPQWDASLPELDKGVYCEEMGKMVYRLRDGQVRAETAIKCIYLPTVSGLEISEISSVGPGAALRRLAPSTLFQHAGAGPHEMRLMANLVRKVPAFELRLGSDIRHLAALVASHLDGLT